MTRQVFTSEAPDTNDLSINVAIMHFITKYMFEHYKCDQITSDIAME